MELIIRGYQLLKIETDDNSTYLFMGDNFVAFNKEQWRLFQEMVSDVQLLDCGHPFYKFTTRDGLPACGEMYCNNYIY
ncbi:MAG: hypothetical protein HMLIMOIP_002073 [Candidatus Nitrosomirales archaeon]|jgi:hypothetical protein